MMSTSNATETLNAILSEINRLEERAHDMRADVLNDSVPSRDATEDGVEAMWFRVLA
jgi:hypothetical protein